MCLECAQLSRGSGNAPWGISGPHDKTFASGMERCHFSVGFIFGVSEQVEGRIRGLLSGLMGRLPQREGMS